MTVQGMDDVGIVVEDLAGATAFFVGLGLELVGAAEVGGAWVDRVVGLEGVRSQIAMVQTPDGHSRLELMEYHTPRRSRVTRTRRRTRRGSAGSPSPSTTWTRPSPA